MIEIEVDRGTQHRQFPSHRFIRFAALVLVSFAKSLRDIPDLQLAPERHRRLQSVGEPFGVRDIASTPFRVGGQDLGYRPFTGISWALRPGGERRKVFRESESSFSAVISAR